MANPVRLALQFFALAVLGAVGLAQGYIQSVTVLTRGPAGGPVAVLQTARVGTPGVVTLGRFPSDGLVPLCVTVDPLDRGIVAAFDLGNGSSRIVRFVTDGAAVLQERVLADRAGTVTSLCILGEEVVGTVRGAGGGMFALPRLGGTPVLRLSQPDLVMVHASTPTGTVPILARGGASPTVGSLTPEQTIQLWLPVSPGGTDLVGAAYPAVWPWNQTYSYLVGFGSGTVAEVSVYGGAAVPVTLSPALPPGGMVRLRSDQQLRPVALGGASLPHVYSIENGGSVVLQAGPFAGDPVDFWIESRVRGGAYGIACGTTASQASSVFPPNAGGGQYFVAVYGMNPGAAVLQTLSLQWPPVRGAAALLAAPLPGGCLLLQPGDVVQFRLADPNGTVSQSVPIPAAFAGISGSQMLSQWFGLVPAGLSATRGLVTPLVW